MLYDIPDVGHRRDVIKHRRPSLRKGSRRGLVIVKLLLNHSNDPYAGSPTKTLLRLLLPLNDQA